MARTSRVPAIQTDKLTKYYGPARGIVDLDLSVNEGEIFGFLGPNGAGKTTTIRILLDLIRPTRGRAQVFGHDTQGEPVAVKGLVGYLPGELALWPNLTGRQTLVYLGNLRGGAELQRIEELAARLQLDLGKKFREYSKGNKQKIGLIQAFMQRPRLLILDEPTSGLDPLNQQAVYEIIREARAGGATLFLSSHVLSEVEHTCDRVGIIREGRLVRVGTVADVVTARTYRVELLLGQPVSDEIRGAFAALPGVEGVQATDSTLHFLVQGSLDPVIKQAANYQVITLTSHEPTLEEAFLSYYRPAVAPDPPQATPEQDTGHAA